MGMLLLLFSTVLLAVAVASTANVTEFNFTLSIALGGGMNDTVWALNALSNAEAICYESFAI